MKEVKTAKIWNSFLARYGGDFDLLGLSHKFDDVEVEVVVVNVRDDPEGRFAFSVLVRGGFPNWGGLVDRLVDMTRQLAVVARLHNSSGYYNQGIFPLGARGYASLWQLPDGCVAGYGWMTLIWRDMLTPQVVATAADLGIRRDAIVDITGREGDLWTLAEDPTSITKDLLGAWRSALVHLLPPERGPVYTGNAPPYTRPRDVLPEDWELL